MQTNASTTPEIFLRRANERFHTEIGWLDSWHTFSFGEHYHPEMAGFRSLRVINDDIIAPGQGFGTHPHASMEIFTYVIAGELEHKDSMGNGRIIKAGEFQYMSAGSGVTHSEFNPSAEKPVHLLQIWITPAAPGGEPRYADFDTKPLRQENGLTLLASPSGAGSSFAIRQHAEIHFGHLSQGAQLSPDSPFSHHFLHLIKGEIKIADQTLRAGDAAAFGASLPIRATEDSEFLFFALS
ncbi:pirin family protein [Roseibacillus ishigakijimensis]|uniref:Pirin family protein n=1 Tax=Roseibacillus ishigakijimensis TaxID=454146 RepID=A0A934RT61_9BACT|nr:pirin-like bicupin family protein [Roseibacillus ishigakijimensis]MBK1835181.1 pirin family protein [Roseibacillus ishigakijimensis]